MDNNFFDNLNPINLEDSIKIIKDYEEKGKRIDYLIHKVFAQTDAGRELLNIWQESLIMASVVEEGSDVATAGIREGMNRFIRGIILTIRKVENE